MLVWHWRPPPTVCHRCCGVWLCRRFVFAQKLESWSVCRTRKIYLLDPFLCRRHSCTNDCGRTQHGMTAVSLQVCVWFIYNTITGHRAARSCADSYLWCVQRPLGSHWIIARIYRWLTFTNANEQTTYLFRIVWPYDSQSMGGWVRQQCTFLFRCVLSKSLCFWTNSTREIEKSKMSEKLFPNSIRKWVSTYSSIQIGAVHGAHICQYVNLHSCIYHSFVDIYTSGKDTFKLKRLEVIFNNLLTYTNTKKKKHKSRDNRWTGSVRTP